MDFNHPKFPSSSDSISAMGWLEGELRERNFSGKAFAMAPAYSRWEIDEVMMTVINLARR